MQPATQTQHAPADQDRSSPSRAADPHDHGHDDARVLFEPHEAPQLPAPRLPVRMRVRKAFSQLVIALYLPAIFQGLAKTLEYMFRPKATLQYPEERHIPRKGYRGEHRLKKDDQGRPKCVACFMCATACPAECITIEAGVAPWPDRDKVPVRFDIDLLKCIYCGMCEEACPCDAIELTTTYTQVSTSRGEKVYDMERLLRN